MDAAFSNDLIDHQKSGRPLSLRYCFRTAPPYRFPLPPATIMAAALMPPSPSPSPTLRGGEGNNNVSFFFFDLGKDHPAGGGLKNRGDHDVDFFADQPAAFFHHHHRAVIEVAD